MLELARTKIPSVERFSTQEACLRSSISRAYYAAFGAAREFAITTDRLVVSRDAQDHIVVRNHYIEASDKTRKLIGRSLNLLRTERN